MGGGAQWRLQMGALGEKRQLVTVTLPGFADRNGEPAIDTITGFARSVIADLDALNIKEFDLLGHSMGGMIVQEVMRHVGVRVPKLILYGTGPVGVLPGRFETIAESKRRAQADGLKATAHRIASTWFLKGKAAPQYQECATLAAQTADSAFEAGLDAMQNWSGEGLLAHIKAETLVLWGDQDRTYPWSQPHQLWQGIQRANLAVVPNCAHAVHLEKPELFNALVGDFLQQA